MRVKTIATRASLMPVTLPPPPPATSLSAPLIARSSNRPVILRAPPVRWEYDTFLESVNEDAIQAAEMPQDQKCVHVWFTDGSQRDMVLPIGYDHVGFLLSHHVQLHISKNVGPSAFSFVDIMLFTVQAIVLSRFVFIDANKKKEKDKDKDAMRKSGEIISSMFIDDSTLDVKESLNNKLLMSMSGTIAQDLVSGVIRNTTGTNGDIVHIARMTYELIASYGIMDLQTHAQIDNFLKVCYRQARNIIRRNFIYVCRLKEYIETYDMPPTSQSSLMEIVEGISCKIKKNKMKIM